MIELADGIRRVTFRLPFGIDHVHCYLVRASDRGWTVVDAGLGLPDARDRWRQILARLDGPVTRILVTHYHPDHVGASADLTELTGATVYQNAVDYGQCLTAWGEARMAEALPEYMSRHGLPPNQVETLRGESEALVALVRFARDPEPLDGGNALDGWDVLHLPGHADGHLALLRRGVLIAGDTILGTITPNVGLYPDARPDPLGDYLSSLGRIEALAPHVAYPGHGEPVLDPGARAREIVQHHRRRLVRASEALAGGELTAYEASLVLFPEPLAPALRRFALTETRAHLEYLVHRDAARRLDSDGVVFYGDA
ncbi:MAG: MBL fold metallo-hydrolase [Gaiellaceae bacterium]